MLVELPRYETCFVCGFRERNPIALGLVSRLDVESGVVTAHFTPGREHEGYPEVVHGGILVSLLDEVSIWAASYAAQAFCVTAELHVKFIKPARPGEPLRLEARVEEHRRRLVRVEARAQDAQGRTVARSAGAFVPLFEEEWRRRAPPALLKSGQERPEQLR